MAFLRIADNAAGKGAGNLLEQDFAIAVLHGRGGVLVKLGRLGMESQQVFARVILIIGYLAGDGPEIAMHVKEIHVHGNLDAVFVEELFLIHFVHNDHLAVGHGSNQTRVFLIGGLAVGNAEEPGDEHHEHKEQNADGKAHPPDMDELRNQEDEQGANEPTGNDGPVRVPINSYPFHSL